MNDLLSDKEECVLMFFFQVAVAHTIGHVAATVSMSKVAVSFTHIIKSGEPAFSVLVSRFFLGETFPLPVYLSLLPIIGGCALAAVTELNFNIIGTNIKILYKSGFCNHLISHCLLCDISLIMVYGFGRVYGSNDIEFGICVSEYLFEKRDEREISERNELLRLLIDDVSFDPHSICYRCRRS